MTSAEDPAGETTAYGWDGAGNRTSVKAGDGPEITTAYDGAGHPVESSDGTEYATDPTGALRAVRGPGGETTTYRYDPFGRMNRAAASGEVATYAHDALSRTVTRTQGEEETAYAYAGATQELAREAAGGESTRYANAPSGPLARKVGGASPQWLLRDVHTDLVGAVSTGGLEASFTWDPWGEPRHRAGESTLGFQADPTDPLTGLVDMGARDYDPGLGRFTTRDPLFGETKEPLSLNQFLYGLASPLTFYDPEGLDAFRVSSRCRFSCPRSMRTNSADRKFRPRAHLTHHRSAFGRSGRRGKWYPGPKSVDRGRATRPPPRTAPRPGSIASLSRTAKRKDFLGNDFRRANLAATGVSREGFEVAVRQVKRNLSKNVDASLSLGLWRFGVSTKGGLSGGWGIGTPGLSVTLSRKKPPIIETRGSACVAICASYGVGITRRGRWESGWRFGVGWPPHAGWWTSGHTHGE